MSLRDGKLTAQAERRTCKNPHGWKDKIKEPNEIQCNKSQVLEYETEATL